MPPGWRRAWKVVGAVPPARAGGASGTAAPCRAALLAAALPSGAPATTGTAQPPGATADDTGPCRQDVHLSFLLQVTLLFCHMENRCRETRKEIESIQLPRTPKV